MTRATALAPLPLLFSLAACGGAPSGPVGEFQVQVGAGFDLTLTHPSGLSLDITGAGFRPALGVYEMQFGSFLIEDRPLGEWRGAARLEGASRDDDGLSAQVVDDAGQALGRLTVRPSLGGVTVRVESDDPAVNRAFIALGCDAATSGGFLGFGAQTHDVDHRGQIVPVWVSEQGIGKVDTDTPADVWFLVGTRHQSYLSVPTMLAPRAGASYGLHAPTFYRSIWDLCASDPDTLRVEIWEGAAELVISPGPKPLDVVRQQTALTGRIPKAPDWTFGVWMEAIGGTAAVEAEAQRLRDAQIPASALWTEDWRGGIDQGVNYILEEDWRWDRDLYPGLPEAIGRLHDQGLGFMTYFNTFVVTGVDVYPELRDAGFLVKDRAGEDLAFQAPDFEASHLADLFTPGARAFVKDELKAALQMGIDGWMADFAEWYPADPRAVMTSDGRDPEAAHHQYPLEWAVVNREAVDEAGADDAVIFHRSGYTGSQGKAHVVWAGDQRTSFQTDDGLPTIVPILMGLSVTGFPVVTHDIAGYVSATNPPSTKDLFLRWTSLGALAPVMRTHHGRAIHDNWRWDRDADTTAHFKRWADLHTRLFPLWAGLAQDASETGAPILRPMAFADPGDVRLHGIKDAYLVGDALLVAPVVTASVAARQVSLPAGTWYDWESGEALAGGGEVTLQVPLRDLGLLARAGAVVPLLPEGVQTLRRAQGLSTLDGARRTREVRVWLGAEGAAREPEGGRYTLESGSRPGSIAGVTGAQDTLLDAPGRRVFTAAPGAVTLTDEAGSQHILRADGVPADMALTWDVRW
jgi:alpha-glucosidase